MKYPIPDSALAQHIAVLGKTGSGKTSTAKLIIEHVVTGGARVCILDPIKSDWWGLTSSADGKRPGLPFHILGGPHGHVPLHHGAGAAIAELVATAALPLSIIDMADFGPGGQAKFFAQFAPMLLKKMKGVLYLVMEEAHEFAPKERSGIGEENIAVHYSKKIATAGRSKGIRLIACSQRVQALHNAILGSCDTVIVHRMTAPADQEPVSKWLKGNVKDKAIRQQIEESLPGLKTGHGWLCSGEAKLLEVVQFPRIATFDNSATPSGDSEEINVRTAAVDRDKLRALIGDAVTEAEANDPAELKKRIRELEKQVAAKVAPALSAAELSDLQKEAWADGHATGKQDALKHAATVMRTIGDDIAQMFSVAIADNGIELADAKPSRSKTSYDGLVAQHASTKYSPARSSSPVRTPVSTGVKPRVSGDSEIGAGGKRRIMIALAQNPDGITQRKLSILVDIAPKGGTWRTYMAELRGRGWIEGGKDRIRITDAGAVALGDFEPLPTGDALIQYWRQRLGESGKRAIFDAVVAARPSTISVDEVSEQTGIARTGGTWRTYMAELRGLGIIEGRDELRASEDLF